MITDFAARRVLVCLRYGIGDVVMETPVLRSLRAALPGAWITALGAAPAVELLEGDAAVDEVVSLGRWGVRHRWHSGAPDAADRLSRWLDEQRFDLFLDVHHVAPLVGEAVWGRGIRSLEADEAVEAGAIRNGADGVSAIRMAVEAGWGLRVPEDRVPALHVPAAAERFADGFLRSRGLGDAELVAISPIASSELKRWPAERFAEVADELLRETDGPLLLFCGPQEESLAPVTAAMRRPERVVPVGALHLQRVAALLSRCRLLVCNDTGVMHMAAALGVPTVGVFGPTPPDVYRPPLEHARAVFSRSPCCSLRDARSMHPPRCIGSGRCRIAADSCIQHVSTTAVLRASRDLLDAGSVQQGGETGPVAEVSA